VYSVLVADGDPMVRAFLSRRLGEEGYHVDQARTGEEALDIAGRRPPDIVVLDPDLPETDGLELLARLRGWTRVPVLILSQRGAEADKVRMLDVGADDYVTKPFGVAELLARVRVHIRRAEILSTERAGRSVVDLGELKVYLTERRATLRDEHVALAPREWDLLRELAQNIGKVLSHKQLLVGAWGFGYARDECSLRTYVKQLRKKIEPDPKHPRYIMTQPGMGYRLCGPAEPSGPACRDRDAREWNRPSASRTAVDGDGYRVERSARGTVYARNA
jgi:two-component system KDP operon response regulator KdpE